jgi:hypothetical protein
MQKQIDNIERDVKLLVENMHKKELENTARLTKLETTQRSIISISSILFTGLVTGVAQLLGMFK